MALSEIIAKLIGVVLALVGLALLLSAAGISLFGVHVDNTWIALILGFIFVGAGIYIIRGGTISI